MLLEQVLAVGIDVEEIKSEYIEAERRWAEYHFTIAKTMLEDTKTKIENLLAREEITDKNWFETANQTITTARKEGRDRDALIMETKLKKALEYWEELTNGE